MYCCVHRMTRYDEETGCYRGSQQFTHPQPDKHTTFCINTQHALIKYNPSSKHTIISDNYINRYILSPYSLLMRGWLISIKTSHRSYDYKNENICIPECKYYILFDKVHFRKLHDHISLSCLCIHNALLLINVFERSVF